MLWWLVCKKSKSNKLRRLTFKLGWNKSTGLVCTFHLFLHRAESQGNSAPWKATVGWYQVTAEKMTKWMENTKKKNQNNTTKKLGSSVDNLLGWLSWNILDWAVSNHYLVSNTLISRKKKMFLWIQILSFNLNLFLNQTLSIL